MPKVIIEGVCGDGTSYKREIDVPGSVMNLSARIGKEWCNCKHICYKELIATNPDARITDPDTITCREREHLASTDE